MSGTRSGATWRALLLGGALVAATAIPVQAANTWNKILPLDNEAQGLAAAPNGGAYVVSSPTLWTGKAVLSSYTTSGSRSWATTLGETDTQAFGVVSDSSGNAYALLYHSLSDGNGVPYFVQQVRKNGTLGWTATWHDDDGSLKGDAIAIKGTTIYVAQRDTTTGTTTIRRFRTSDGTTSTSWKLSGSKAPVDRPVDLAVRSTGAYLLDVSGKLVGLKTSGAIDWTKTLPGAPGIGGAMAVDSTGISVWYDARPPDDPYVARYSLTGSRKWAKAAPDGINALSIATLSGTTYLGYVTYVSNAVQGQVKVTRYDKNGGKKSTVTAGTKNQDTSFFLMTSGDYVYSAGYTDNPQNQPLLQRMDRP